MRKAKNVKKLIAIILLVSLILRFCFVIIHINHDCIHDDNCPICIIIHKYNEDIKGFNPNISKSIIITIIVITLVVLHVKDKISAKKKHTLFGLKVELIN